MKDELSRREFLKRAAHVAAGIAVSGGIGFGAVSGAKEAAPPQAIPTRVFGKTGVRLPVLGYGGAALPTRWGNPLSYEDREKLVRYAYDRGVRYFDTAGNYMESQWILGRALKGIRGDVYLATKVETTVPGEVRGAVEKSLKDLKTDYLDLIQIHGTPGVEQMSVGQAMAIHGELVKLREEEVVRFIGFSAHSYFDKALALIETGGFDQCMLAYGYLPRGHDQMLSPRMVGLRDACLAKAHELGMGIVAMKVIGAGVLGAWSGYIVPGFDAKRREKLPGAAMRYVLQDKRFHVLAIGMRLKAEIDANTGTLWGDVTYTADDEALLAEYCAKARESAPIKGMRVD